MLPARGVVKMSPAVSLAATMPRRLLLVACERARTLGAVLLPPVTPPADALRVCVHATVLTWRGLNGRQPRRHRRTHL
jgi:hypothetical protein